MYPVFPGEPENLLPYDGEAYLTRVITGADELNRIFLSLYSEINWQNDRVKMFGQLIITARKTAWYGDPGKTYKYSGMIKSPIPWSQTLLNLKSMVENVTGLTFNSCLLNLYQNGTEGMSWHSDDEQELGPLPCIASLSLGAERRFSFRHKHSAERIDILLPAGSLLLMKGNCQKYWKHALPLSKKVTAPRINLTFRHILGE